MKSYKDPSFQDRVGRAAKAKQEALDRLRTKPPVAEAEKAAVAQATSKPSTDRAPLSEAERKAARDARYAARKKRK